MNWAERSLYLYILMESRAEKAVKLYIFQIDKQGRMLYDIYALIQSSKEKIDHDQIRM